MNIDPSFVTRFWQYTSSSSRGWRDTSSLVYSSCQTVAQRVAEAAKKAFRAVKTFGEFLYFLSLMGYKIIVVRFTEGRDAASRLLPERHEIVSETAVSAYLRRFFSKPIEISSVSGLDPRIAVQHFSEAIVINHAFPRLAPEADILALKEQFNLINTTDPADPYYFDTSSLALDADTPATFEDLKNGLNRVLDGISQENDRLWPIANGKKVKPQLQDIYHLLTTRADVSTQDKVRCLIDLAKAGKRICPTRLSGECLIWNEALRQDIIILTLPEMIAKILHGLKLQILSVEMAESQVHRLNEYLLSIGSKIGIYGASEVYNDDPFLIRDLAPQVALPDFLRRYTAERIVNYVLSAINDPPHSITPVQITEWFLEHIPSDFMPNEEGREEAYMLQHVYEAASNRVKAEAVEYMLINMNILQQRP